MCARLRAVERLAQQYTQSRITQIDGCTRKYSGALSCTHERNIGYFALMWHSDVPRNRIFVFLCAVVARKLWEFGRLGICAMPRHCKNSECARLCTYLDRCVYACGCGQQKGFDKSQNPDGGGYEIRTREAVTPTRFPSVRHRPLGESSMHCSAC